MVKDKTMAYDLYGRGKTWERHRHRYEGNPKHIAEFEAEGLVFLQAVVTITVEWRSLNCNK